MPTRTPDAVTTTSGERLNRYLARRGIASRRGADSLIAAGQVQVNGMTAVAGTVIDPGRDRIEVDGRVIDIAPASVTIMLNKPRDVVSTCHAPQGRPTVMELVEPQPGLVPVGRLDADSHGLLLLSTDGELTHRLSHPRYGIAKTYHVTVTPPPTPTQVLQIRAGVHLIDGPARPLHVRMTGKRGDAVIEIVMGEGRKREVRRICEAVGLRVKDLRRVAYGPLKLVGVAEGQARRLSEPEVEALYEAVGLVPPHLAGGQDA